ncbi:hypothetical protein C2E23DRAFT_830100 [Lenzites betulinus]|nr:hypothetical protein C2E23DRAFT_830100 [Lenzites betulinus]
MLRQRLFVSILAGAGGASCACFHDIGCGRRRAPLGGEYEANTGRPTSECFMHAQCCQTTAVTRWVQPNKEIGRRSAGACSPGTPGADRHHFGSPSVISMVVPPRLQCPAPPSPATLLRRLPRPRPPRCPFPALCAACFPPSAVPVSRHSPCSEVSPRQGARAEAVSTYQDA